MTVDIICKIDYVRAAVSAARAGGKKVGFVPTMGALHAGHVSLIDRAVADCDFVVVSIFVNPTQFGPSEDFDRYPRDLTADAEICEKAGVDVIFAPEVNEMYPVMNVTWVDVEGLTDRLCGLSRPGHFRGVTTVCAKLFNIVLPDVAYFGQKDAQQAVVIKRMAADLNISLDIEICPIVRHEDGLALSSRNKYLSDGERKDALLLSKSLYFCEKMAKYGEKNTAKLAREMKKILSQGDIEVEYLCFVDAETLEDVEEISQKTLVAVAGRVGKTRLIDNIILDLNNIKR